jgi:hypothetical protein
MRCRIILLAGLLALASCSRGEKQQNQNLQNQVAQPENPVEASDAEGAQDKFRLVGVDDKGHRYYSSLPGGIEVSNLHEGQTLNVNDEQKATDFMLGANYEKGCCRVRVRWRVVVKKPAVTVRNGGVTVNAPEVTVGHPTVAASGWPEIRWNARSLIPSADPPEYYDITTQCVDEDKGSTVFVVNNENKPVSVRIQVEGMSFDIALEKRERRPMGKWADRPCSITQNYVIVFGERKP